MDGLNETILHSRDGDPVDPSKHLDFPCLQERKACEFVKLFVREKEFVVNLIQTLGNPLNPLFLIMNNARKR